MADFYSKLSGQIDRRSPNNEGNPEDPILRENFLARDGILKKPKGTVKAVTALLDDKPRWIGRYYTIETGQISPKTFVYTQDGQLWVIDDQAKTATSIKELLNENRRKERQLLGLEKIRDINNVGNILPHSQPHTFAISLMPSRKPKNCKRMCLPLRKKEKPPQKDFF